MRHRQVRTLAALAVVSAMTLAGCGSDDDGNGSTVNGTKGEFNSAIGAVYNASDKTGGTLKLGKAGDWGDSVDPGDTYYGYSWNFARNYGRSLTMFKVVPGSDSAELVPDLAEDLGVATDGGKTWTYKIRQGVKFEDGSEVKAADVAYGVARSFDREVLPNGPEYLAAGLDWPEGFTGVFKDPDADFSSAIETPDDYTIIFHLKQAYAGFDYFAMLPQTIPVPKAADTGAKYKEHVVSTGPYKFETYDAGKHYVLVRNDQWDQSTDPNRNPLPDTIDVQLNLAPDDVDNQIIAGDLHVDITGTGVQPGALNRVLSDPTLKARADNPEAPRTNYVSVIGTVKPLDNVECRRAVGWAVDKTGYQAAYGGEFAGGDIATSMLPPLIPGHEGIDPYGTPDNKGDVAKAKEALAACGQPDGFSTVMAYRTERPKEKATAESFQQALAKAGITLTLKGYTEGDYFSQYVGNPKFAKDNGIGLATNSWQADWNDGFGFLSQIMDSRVIRPGSSNLSVRDPEIDALIDQGQVEPDVEKRNAIWAEIDQKVMDNAFVVPGVWSKAVTLRGTGLTNVFVNEAFGQYDYISMGVE